MEWHHANRPLTHANPPHTHTNPPHTHANPPHTRTNPETHESSSHTRILLTHANRQTTVACFDLLAPEICEIVGGSLREYHLPQLLQSMRRHGLLQPGCLQDVAQVKEMASSPVIQYG